MSHTVGHKLPTALSDAASLALSGVWTQKRSFAVGYEFGLISTAAMQ